MNKILSKQIELTASQISLTALMNAVLISINGMVLWGEFDDSLVLGWMIYGYTLSIVRAIVLPLLDRHFHFSQKPELLKHIILISVFLSGSIWAFAALYFLDTTNIVVLLVVCLSIAGVAHGGIASLSVYLPAIYCFGALPLIVATWQLYQLDSLALSLISLLNLISLAVVSYRINQEITRSITLDFKNSELLEAVKIEKENAIQSQQQAEASNRSKSEFLAAASHDLRQPLHAMGLFIDALSARSSDTQTEEHAILKKISSAHKSLTGMFDSLLEISQLDTGSINPIPHSMNLSKLLERLVDEFRPLASAKEIQLVLNTHNEYVYSDPILLSRVIRNLISNAVKFTQTGKVEINTCTQDSIIKLSILDTGIGIPTSQLSVIFDEYIQLNNPERDRSKGIGLGLSLVKRMSKLLDIQIQVASICEPSLSNTTHKNGSQFTLLIPIAKNIAKDTPVQVISTTLGSDKTVVLIDDEADIRDAITITLQDAGFHVISSESGEQAIQQLASQSITPDVILSDFRLRSKQTGLDAISKIRSYLNTSVPAIIITGDTDPKLVNTIKKQGYCIVHKPVRKPQLLTAIRQQLITSAPPEFEKQVY